MRNVRTSVDGKRKILQSATEIIWLYLKVHWIPLWVNWNSISCTFNSSPRSLYRKFMKSYRPAIRPSYNDYDDHSTCCQGQMNAWVINFLTIFMQHFQRKIKKKSKRQQIKTHNAFPKIVDTWSRAVDLLIAEYRFVLLRTTDAPYKVQIKKTVLEKWFIN